MFDILKQIFFVFLLIGTTECSDTSTHSIPHNDRLDTDIPEAEDFDAYGGVWNSQGTGIIYQHDVELGDDPSPQKLDQIWIYSFQTGQREKILDGRALNLDWHPNGEWISFHSFSIPEFIFKVKKAGTHRTKLTGEGSPNQFENTNYARFSPSGDRILFAVVAGTPRGISIMDTTGAGAEIIIPYGVMGSWFPDGNRIVYVNWDTTAVSGRRRQIYTANPNGTDQLKLTDLDNSGSIAAPVVSPGGDQIAFAHKADEGTVEIFLMNSSGNNIRQITTGEGVAIRPEWHPDGERILFSRVIYNVSRNLYLIDLATLEVEPVFQKNN